MAPAIAAALVAGGTVALLAAIGLGAGSRRWAGRHYRWLEAAATTLLVGFGVLALVLARAFD